MLGMVEIQEGNLIPRPVYSTVSSQFAIAQPSAHRIEQYSPINTAPSTCSKLVLRNVLDRSTNRSTDIELSPNIPVAPSRRLCMCMMEQARCIAKETTNSEARSLLRNFCNRAEMEPFCLGVKANLTIAQFPAFGGCNNTEKASWAFSKFTESKNNDPAACNSIDGTTQQPIGSKSQDSGCEDLLRQAGPEGTGTITYIPSPISKSNAVNNKEASGIHLKAAAKAGIGVGILTLFTFVIIAMFVRARRKKKSNLNEVKEFQKPELEDNSKTLEERAENLDGSERIELDAQGDGVQRTELGVSERQEMGVNGERHEIGVDGERYEIGVDGERYELPSDERKRPNEKVLSPNRAVMPK
jgi:hypothetical protein